MFRVVETDNFCIWFEYDYKGRTYHGCYNCDKVFMEEEISEKSPLYQEISELCEEYVFGDYDDWEED